MIKKKLSSILPLILLLYSVLSGCETQDYLSEDTPQSGIAIRMASLSLESESQPEVHSPINDLTGYRIENGLLVEIYDHLSLNQDNVCTIQPSQPRGEIYFLANASGLSDTYKPEVGKTTADEFLSLKATAKEMTANGHTMTGHLTLPVEAGKQPVVELERSIARIDLLSSMANVQVQRVEIKNLVAQGHIYSGVSGQPDTESRNLSYDFGSNPFGQGEKTLFYVCEQTQSRPEAEIYITINGSWHRLKTSLPTLKRNTVYTLKVYGSGAEAKVEVLAGDWGQGVSSESELIRKFWIDGPESVLPEGSRLSSASDTLFIPYQASSIQLAVRAEEGAQIVVNGIANGVTCTPGTQSKVTTDLTHILVSKNKTMPAIGQQRQFIYLDAYKQNRLTGRIVLLFEPNPIRILNGSLQFDTNSVCDFNGYADGTFAQMAVEQGMSLEVSCNNNEQWARITPIEGTANVYHLEGGWRPNDPNADGREQSATLILKNEKGERIDSYLIKRKNWTLPVVNINGTWWCKYNLRGNVKKFEDQILVATDPAKEGSPASYMASCSNDDLLAVIGDQYQGGNPEGLKLTYKDGSFYYEGFQSQAQDFGAMKAGEMAPAGFEIPQYSHFRFFTGSDDFGLALGSDGFYNGKGQRLTYQSQERTASFGGGNYGAIHLYDFQYENAHLVLCGLGHQWEDKANAISTMMILLATNGVTGKSWVLEGYAKDSSNKGKTWMKYVSQNSTKTRTIRCIKSEAYIY